MTNLFLLHADEDAACAETLYARLATQGYRLWRESHNLQVSDIIYPHATENAILGSAVVLLLLSNHAAYSIEVARHLSFAMDLKKTIIPVVLDKIDLPAMLHGFPPLIVQSSCTDVAAQLMQQSLLPPPNSTDPLIKLAELAASDLLTKRKSAVQQASAMLQRNQQRMAVLAILAYLAQDDPMSGVREAAQDTLIADAYRQETLRPPLLYAFQQGDMVGVRCKTCEHVTYFNKRRICTESRPVTCEEKYDKFKMRCDDCGETMMVEMYCEDYR